MSHDNPSNDIFCHKIDLFSIMKHYQLKVRHGESQEKNFTKNWV